MLKSKRLSRLSSPRCMTRSLSSSSPRGSPRSSSPSHKCTTRRSSSTMCRSTSTDSLTVVDEPTQESRLDEASPESRRQSDKSESLRRLSDQACPVQKSFLQVLRGKPTSHTFAEAPKEHSTFRAEAILPVAVMRGRTSGRESDKDSLSCSTRPSDKDDQVSFRCRESFLYDPDDIEATSPPMAARFPTMVRSLRLLRTCSFCVECSFHTY